MSRAFILGAGCSRNYSEGTTKIDGLVSPIDSDFFKMAKKVVLARGGDYMFYGVPPLDHFLKHLSKLYGYADLLHEPIDLFDDPRLSLENVMTTFSVSHEIFERPFYMYGFESSLPSSNVDQLATLKELIAETIFEALEGPPCEKHIKLAEAMNGGDIVLSFNYDMLIENALRELEKFTDDGYIISFHSALIGDRWVKPQDQGSPVRVAKLHGSLNWLRCSYCGSNLLLRYQKIGQWLTSLTSLPENRCSKCKSGPAHWQRLLVPPILTKNYNDPAINYLWLEAERILKNVKEVIVIGYSLSRADFASETLLRRALGVRACQIPVTIVNPDKEVKERFSRIFNPEKVVQIETFEEYLQSI